MGGCGWVDRSGSCSAAGMPLLRWGGVAALRDVGVAGPVQKKPAGVADGFGELIENNRRGD